MFIRATEPQSIGAVLDSGFKLFAASWKVVFIPAILATASSSLANFYLFFRTGGFEVQPEWQAVGPLFIVLLFAGIILYFGILGGIIHRIDAVANVRESSFGRDLAVGFRAVPRLIVGGILYGLIIVVGLVLLVIPGIILSVSLAFYIYAIVLDDKGPVDCLNYSHGLVWGDWWRTAALSTIAFIFAVVIYSLLIMVIGFLTAVQPSQDIITLIDVMSLLLEPVIAAVVTPLLFSMGWAIYRDLQVRKEGGDLEARIGEMEGV